MLRMLDRALASSKDEFDGIDTLAEPSGAGNGDQPPASADNANIHGG